MTIYALEDITEEQPITFRIYNAERGVVLSDVLTSLNGSILDVSYRPNDLMGDYDNPVKWTACEQIAQLCKLKSGWNWISLYVKPDEDNEFYLPAPDYVQGNNRYRIKGGMKIYEDLYEEPPMPDLVENGYYPFYAVSRYKAAVLTSRQGGPNRAIKTFEPYVESGLTPWYDIYLLRLPDEPIPMAVDEVDTHEGDPVYYYYDLNGRRSMSPHDGFNIVVKRQGQHTHATKSYRHND